MTTPSPVNPVDIARIALKRLAERGLPPTPENYSQFYYAVLTVKAPQSKSVDELRQAWELLAQLDELADKSSDLTSNLLDTLAGSTENMVQSLGSLQHARQAHAEQRTTLEESHSVLEGLLNDVISTTREVHGTVSTSHGDLQKIRDSLRHIEEDLAFNRKALEQDALTGALNRQGLDHLLLREVKQARRGNGKLSVVLFDLDDFKLVNDHFSHEVGDLVLIHLTNLTKAVLRETDYLVRYGGEEFMLVLPDTDSRGAEFVLERLRQVTARTPYVHHGQRIEIRFSAGVACLKEEENGRAMVLRADEALYRAKRSGRGRTELAS